MKGKALMALAVCVILLFTATAAYAREGNAVLNCANQENYILEKNKNDKQNWKAGAANQGNKGNKANKENKSNKGNKGNKGNKANKGYKGKEFVAVAGITLSKTSTTLKVNSWERLSATVQPANATDKKYFWFSSNPMIASVNPSGKITGLSPGTAVIYVATRDGFKTANCTVTVEGSPVVQVPVTGVALNYSTLTLNTGDGRRLTAEITPGNASNKAVTWQSSNPAAAVVNQNGYVFGVDDGTAVITVCTADGGKTAACTVTVRHQNSGIPVSSVSITGAASSIAIKQGGVKHLNVEVLPGNASNKTVVWQTSNPNIVSVDQNGNISGVNEGTATVTVTTAEGSKHDSCTVRVIPADEWVGVTGVSLNLISTTIPVGFTDTLRYQIGPSGASDQDVRWSSSNTAVVAVNDSGRIEAKAVGTAVITAATVDGNKTTGCLVVVTSGVNPPSHGILLNKTASTMLEGEFDYPALIYYPANANSYYLTWTSSDTGVATVDQNGRVTARDRGTAVITVRTSNGWSASYTVTVIE